MMRSLAQMIFAVALVEFVPVVPVEQYHPSLPEAGPRDIISEIVFVTEGVLPQAAVLPPQKKDTTRLGVVTSAASAFVMDEASHKVLYEKNADEVRPIGSLTKLMTTLVFMETHPDFSAPASVIEEDLRSGGRDHLYVDDQVTVRDLFSATLVGSDNPATMALMRLSGLSSEAFVTRMNERAKELGMIHSFFTEPTGLDSNNVSTAREISLVLSTALRIPEIAEMTRQSFVEFTSLSGRLYRIPTTNLLLTSYLNVPPYSIAGGKTGYLPTAGYSLGTLVRDGYGHGVYSIVLGSLTLQSRFQEVKGLTQWAFDVFEWPAVGGSG